MSKCKKQSSKRETKTRNHRFVDGWNNRTQFGCRANRTRQTIWRWQRDGKLPVPDGHDPFGNPLWRDSTIDAFLAGGDSAAA